MVITVNADPSQLTADQRPVRLRRRLDLVLSQCVFQSETTWVVKDPLALKYIQLRPPEYSVFKMLDGNTSLREMKKVLDDNFPDKHSRISDIHSLITSFHENGMLIADAPGQHEAMLKERFKRFRKKVIEVVSSPLAIRFPGVDPDRFLNWLHPRIVWFFHPVAIAIGLLTCLAALILVMVNLPEFFSKLPGFHQFFGARNLLLMGGLLIVTKTIHEFGHGLACKHFGGECHEIGVMLLVLMPTMYCNVTDSWVLANKWHRMAIGAAGMFVEIVVAAICTFLWWFSVPGAFNYICLNIVFLCSFSTIVFNANPLLRYDGYYMLADWLEIPNMSQKSRSALMSWARQFFLGMRPMPARMLPERKQWLFALYSVASFVYRWFVIFMILWFVTEIFEPWGLAVVGYSLAAASFVVMLAVPLWKACKYFGYPGRTREVKRKKFIATTTGFLVIAAFVIWFPLPRSVPAPLVIRITESASVYVQSPGRLTKVLVQAGESVEKQQILAVLENTETMLQVEELRGEIARIQHEIELYLRVGERRDPVGREVARLQSELVAARHNLVEAEKMADMLVLRAPRSGVVTGPTLRHAQPIDRLEMQPWFGSPLWKENQFVLLESNTLFCQIGDPSQIEARLVVDQGDIKYVEAGDRVVVILDEYPGRRFYGVVEEVSTTNLKSTPPELSKSSGGPIVVSPDQPETQKPMFASYEVLVHLDTDGRRFLSGFRGIAKINVRHESLGRRLYRLIGKTFHFR